MNTIQTVEVFKDSQTVERSVCVCVCVCVCACVCVCVCSPMEGSLYIRRSVSLPPPITPSYGNHLGAVSSTHFSTYLSFPL